MFEKKSQAPNHINLAQKKVLKDFQGYSSTVELIEVDGLQLVLKTVDEEEAWNEKRFLSTMATVGLPSLQVFTSDGLADNQILLEYLPGSVCVNLDDMAEVVAWGRAVKAMHAVTFDTAHRITSENKIENLDWRQHVFDELDNAVQKHQRIKSDISLATLLDIQKYVHANLGESPQPYSLLHCDLHNGNTLIKNGEIVLYDKGSSVFAGDPMYDLAIMMTHFPNGTYLTTDTDFNRRDLERLNAFMSGYGERFLDTQRVKLDVYTVVRALDRHPNPFEIFNKAIIENIIYKDIRHKSSAND